MAAEVTETAIKSAVWKRASYIMENLDSMTLKSCRRQLEVDMSLEKDALKPMKDLISLLIDEVIARHKASMPAAELSPDSAEASSPQEEAEEERPKQRRKKEAREDKPRKKQKREEEEEKRKPAAPRQYSKLVEKLRALCKSATITIPPSLYKNKDNSSLEEALEALLQKHGLNADSGEKAVAKVKHRLAMQRELEGIDTSNILSGGRRPRAATQAARANYASIEAPAGSDDEEERGEDASDDGGRGSDREDSGEGSAGSSGLSQQSQGASESEGGEEEDEGLRRLRPPPSSKGRAAPRSPDENKVPPKSAEKAGPH